MIFLFQFLPLILPLNQTFSCHTVPISMIHRDVEIEIEEGKSTFFIETNE